MSALGLELQGLYDCARLAPAAPAAYVYVISAPHAVKVGITILTPQSRLEDIKRATGILAIAIAATWAFPTRDQAYQTEQGAHWHLRDQRIIGEWFDCTPEGAIAAVEKVIEHGQPLGRFTDPPRRWKPKA